MKIYVDATPNEVCLVIEVYFEGLTARATVFFDINAKTNNEAKYLAVLSAIKYLARESCQDCCDNPDYYWLFSSRHLTLEKVKKWSQKTITSSG